jgi:hypothetical protein
MTMTVTEDYNALCAQLEKMCYFKVTSSTIFETEDGKHIVTFDPKDYYTEGLKAIYITQRSSAILHMLLVTKTKFELTKYNTEKATFYNTENAAIVRTKRINKTTIVGIFDLNASTEAIEAFNILSTIIENKMRNNSKIIDGVLGKLGIKAKNGKTSNPTIVQNAFKIADSLLNKEMSEHGLAELVNYSNTQMDDDCIKLEPSHIKFGIGLLDLPVDMDSILSVYFIMHKFTPKITNEVQDLTTYGKIALKITWRSNDDESHMVIYIDPMTINNEQQIVDIIQSNSILLNFNPETDLQPLYIDRDSIDI